MEELETELTELEPAVEDALPEDLFSDDTAPEDTLLEDIRSEEPVDDSILEDVPTDSGNETDVENDQELSGEVTEPEEAENEESEEPPATTVSGNDILTISGNAVIFPEDFDFSVFNDNSESTPVDMSEITEIVEYQTRVIYGVSFAALFLLGVIAGVLLIHGFRLRRT